MNTVTRKVNLKLNLKLKFNLKPEFRLGLADGISFNFQSPP